MSSELIPSVSIEALLGKRDGIIAELREAHEALRAADRLAEAWFGEKHRGHRLALRNYSTHTEFTSDKGLEEAIKEIDARAWEFLLSESGLQTFLDATARKQWSDAIGKNDVPELTATNIHATFSTLYAARGDMFERGVVEVFRGLSWDYKTNKPVMFGTRVVLRHIIDSHNLVSHRGCDQLDDLVRVMSVLDGNPEPDSRQSIYRALSDARPGLRAPSGLVTEFRYFSIRTFKNGNGHLTFTRSDLVDKMNAILAKHHPGALARSPDEVR